MEFIVEEIEVKTDHDHDSDTQAYPNCKNEDWKSNSSDIDENVETSDPYFKFKLLVEELLAIFTNREEKCGICVEYIVKLCQHIGQTHDSPHEPDTSTSLNGSTAVTGIHTLGDRNPSRNIDLHDEDNKEENSTEFASQHEHDQSRSSTSNTPSTVNKSKKAQQNKRGFKRKRLNQISCCGLCGKQFPNKCHLDGHILTHTGEKPFECETCGKRFTANSTLNCHTRIHTGEMPYKCDICDKVFRYTSGLRVHKRLVKCKRTKSNYNRRVKTKSYKCSTCAKIFQSKSGLKAHRAVHTGENRFYCGVCGKGFFYNYLLVRHKSTHTGEKQFHCRVCGKYFPYNCLLSKHRLSHKRERKFNCNVCRKSYSYKYGLDKHKLTHTGEKQLKSPQILSLMKVRSKYKCLTCGKSYPLLRELNRHRVVHTKEELYCEVCEQEFRHVGHFKRHMRTHTQ